jgi:hypothetical protein
MSSGRRRAGLPASCYRLFLLLFAAFYQVGYLFSGRHGIVAARHGWRLRYDYGNFTITIMTPQRHEESLCRFGLRPLRVQLYRSSQSNWSNASRYSLRSTPHIHLSREKLPLYLAEFCYRSNHRQFGNVMFDLLLARV